MAGRIDPPTIRMTAPLGVAARRDFVIRTVPRDETLVATLEGSRAIGLEEIVVRQRVEGPDPALQPGPGVGTGHVHTASQPEEPPGVGVGVHYVEVARVGSGEPFGIGPDWLVEGVVTGTTDPAIEPGLRKATLTLSGFSGDGTGIEVAEVRYYGGTLTVELLGAPPVFYRDRWGVLELRVSLPGAGDTELTITSAEPVEWRLPAVVVPPHRGSVTTSIALRFPGLDFQPGPIRVPLMVAGLSPEPIEAAFELELRAGEPEPSAVMLDEGIWSALRNYYTRFRLLFVGLHCFGESTEASASDEPYLIIGALPARGSEPRVEMTPVFENVDAGETHGGLLEVYAGSTILLMVTVTAIENDMGDPAAYKGVIEDFYDEAAARLPELAAMLPLVGPLAAVGAIVATILMKPWMTEKINAVFDTGDDLIDSAVIALTPDEIHRYLATPPADYHGIPAHFSTPVITRKGEGQLTALFRLERI